LQSPRQIEPLSTLLVYEEALSFEIQPKMGRPLRCPTDVRPGAVGHPGIRSSRNGLEADALANDDQDHSEVEVLERVATAKVIALRDQQDTNPHRRHGFGRPEQPDRGVAAMSRDLDQREPERAPEAQPTPEVVVRPMPEPGRSIPGQEPRVPNRDREPVGRYRLSRDEVETLREIGKFRTIAAADLKQFHYGDDSRAMDRELQSLSRRGLLRSHAVLARGNRFHVIALTKDGQRALDRSSRSDPQQAIYAGLVKEREASHDSAIYRMYQAEAASIRAKGGTVRRVVLDFELKRKIYVPLAKERPHLAPEQYAKRQAEVAAENGLEVVNGKIPLPDLRIEYQTREGELAKVDLELATDHYKHSQIAEKAAAGFVVYGEGGGAKPEDRDLISEILSL